MNQLRCKQHFYVEERNNGTNVIQFDNPGQYLAKLITQSDDTVTHSLALAHKNKRQHINKHVFACITTDVRTTKIY